MDQDWKTLYGKDIVALACCMLATFTAATFGAVASVSSADFYSQLVQPSWAPPASVFGPVWSILYLLMAVAAWLVWRERTRRRVLIPLSLFGGQLVLNALWTWLFFYWHLGMVAIVEIIVLWLLILVTAVIFWKVKPAAALLLVPYILWVGFAAALTISLVLNNPEVL